jgi:glycosyltransferase involved in cell wall biosynthesis
MEEACRADLHRYTLDNMVAAYVDGICKALDLCRDGKTAQVRHLAVIWQRFLPYHLARLRHLREHLERKGVRLSAIEVASQDASYGFSPGQSSEGFEWQCLFPGASYHDHSAGNIHGAVLAALRRLHPDAILAPASAFPEGMAAFRYRLESGCYAVMMDDAWAHTARRGALTRRVKRYVHRNIDGAFVPADFYRDYYRGLGFPDERIVVGVDVVDNRFFADGAHQARLQEREIRIAMDLPERYFLFVGRFLPRKGLETMLEAFAVYRKQTGADGWGLVLVGDGPHRPVVERFSAGLPGVHFAGVRQGADLCRYFGLAEALIVPSESDPWGLVVNEGMAAGLPVLVSRGCGAAHTLVRDGENGWTFASGDTTGLATLMARLGSLPPDARRGMGDCSSRIIEEWSLGRFAEGVDAALEFSRRPPAGFVSDLATRLWKGRISVN